MSDWKKLPQIERDDLHIGCLNCSTACLEAPPEMGLPVGFGEAFVTKDGAVVVDAEEAYRNSDGNYIYIWLVCEVEDMAAADPDHDWRIVRNGPLHGETFQRQDGKWLCVESNQGFA